MRCLYCNKKLSLLKLAKGDEFCSSEHFDAHQLQLSKDAIQRLMNAPDETPKAPLGAKKAREETPLRRATDLSEVAPQNAPAPPAANKSQERDLRAMARQEEALPDAANSRVERVPPYALFIVEPPPLATQPPAPVAGDMDPETSFARELSLPMQQIEVTACLLNLHARLTPTETTPLNWRSPRNLILSPGDFLGDIVRPSFIPNPDFPPLENSAPAEPTPLAIAKIELPKPVEPAQAAQTRVPFLTAPSFLERPAPPSEVDTAKPMQNAPVLTPILYMGIYRADLTSAIAKPERFADAVSPEAQNLSVPHIESAPEVSVSASAVFPGTGENTGLHGWSASRPVIGLTSTVFEAGGQRAVSIDFSLPSAESLTIQPAVALPGGAETLGVEPRITRTVSPISGRSISIYEPLPEPPAHAAPIALGAQPPQTRAMNVEILLPTTVNAHSFGQEPAFTDPSVFATEPLPALAQLHAAKPLFVAGWAHRMPHRPLPTSIADSISSRIASLPMVPYHPACVQLETAPVEKPGIPKSLYRSVGRRAIDSAMPHMARPSATHGSHEVLFAAIHDFPAKPGLSTNRTLPLAIGRTFTASTPMLAELNSRSFVGTSFLEATSVPADRGTIRLCPQMVNWEPRLSAEPVPDAVKLLPLREGPLLPLPDAWTPLTALHRQ